MSSPRRQTRNDAREENRLSTPAPDRATSVACSISIQTSPLRTRGARTQYSNYGQYQQFIFTDQNYMFCAQCYIWDSETIKRRKLLLPLRWTTIVHAKSLTVSAY
jgi:hypothetical protein